MRLVTIMLLLSMTTAHAQTVYFNYSQWEQMPTSLREMYVAGAFDAVSVVAIPQQAIVARHYHEWLPILDRAWVNLHKT